MVRIPLKFAIASISITTALISSVFPQYKLTSFHVSFLSRVRVKMVEHYNANAEAMGSNLVEALNFLVFFRAKKELQ